MAIVVQNYKQIKHFLISNQHDTILYHFQISKFFDDLPVVGNLVEIDIFVLYLYSDFSLWDFNYFQIFFTNFLGYIQLVFPNYF